MIVVKSAPILIILVLLPLRVVISPPLIVLREIFFSTVPSHGRFAPRQKKITANLFDFLTLALLLLLR
jgi:hypothetical protein